MLAFMPRCQSREGFRAALSRVGCLRLVVQEMKKKHSQWLEMEAALAAKKQELEKRDAEWRKSDDDHESRLAERRRDEAKTQFERDETVRVKGVDGLRGKGEVGAAKAARRSSETSLLAKAAILTPSPSKERTGDSAHVAVAAQLVGVAHTNGNAAKPEAERARMDTERAEWAREEKEWRTRLDEWRSKQGAWQQMQEHMAREELDQSARLHEHRREERVLLERLERHRMEESALKERIQELLWVETQTHGAANAQSPAATRRSSDVARTPPRGLEAGSRPMLQQQAEFNRKFQTFLSSLKSS